NGSMPGSLCAAGFMKASRARPRRIEGLGTSTGRVLRSSRLARPLFGRALIGRRSGNRRQEAEMVPHGVFRRIGIARLYGVYYQDVLRHQPVAQAVAVDPRAQLHPVLLEADILDQLEDGKEQPVAGALGDLGVEGAVPAFVFAAVGSGRRRLRQPPDLVDLDGCGAQ